MSLAQFELYHGAVLSQIVGNPKINVKLFERNSDHGWGAYEVTDNATTYRVIIKSTSQIRKGRRGGCACAFTFSEADIERLRAIHTNVLVCLVCSDEEICTLTIEDIDALRISMEKSACSVSVTWARDTGLHVKCRGIELGRVIPRNRLKNFEWK